MPYTEKQRKLFNAAAHDKKTAQEHGMKRGQASDLASEANKLKGENKERKPVSKAGFQDFGHVFDQSHSK